MSGRMVCKHEFNFLLSWFSLAAASTAPEGLKSDFNIGAGPGCQKLGFLAHIKKSAPSGNQTRVWSVAGTYTITVLTARYLLVPRIELGTSRVLSERHNQLDHTS